MKGIILAGGSGTRLHPCTISISKQLLPVHDKPMIYYPLSTLMLAGIEEILIITTPHDLSSYKKLLGNGKDFGIQINYTIQNKPNGLAEAFILGDKFIGTDNVCLALGDNIFYGNQLQNILKNAKQKVSESGEAVIIGYNVPDPERFGVAEIDNQGIVISLEEKPKKPKSNFAVTGLYFYPNCVIEKSKKVKKSLRGELEITSINKMYLESNKLHMIRLGRGFSWLDTGTNDALFEASNFLRSVENLTKQKIGCLEEIAYNSGKISKESLSNYLRLKGDNSYFNYLRRLVEIEKNFKSFT